MRHFKRVVVLDVETTGLDYFKDKIIEIALILIKNNKMLDSYHTYLNPSFIVSKNSYNIHGIKNKFLINKPFFKDVYIFIDNFLKNSLLVAHNARFDLKFLKSEYKRIGLYRSFHYFDTLKFARKLFPGKKNNLYKFCSRFGVYSDKYHNAFSDALCLAKTYLKIKNKQLKVR